METLEERGFWKRFLTSGIVAWVSLALSIVAMVRTLPHSNKAPAADLPKPPETFLLDPHKAKVTDTRGNTFSWHEDVGDKIEGDHSSFGGWVADGDKLDFVAYGRASVRGVMQSGILAIAQIAGVEPDAVNRLHIEWPIKVKAGQTLRFTGCLTDRAVRETHVGAKIRVGLGRKGLSSLVLADDEELKPRDDRVIELSQPLTGMENKLILELDNCGSEWWSIIFCNARLE